MTSRGYNKYKYLFLDRDGVINVERPNDYVKTISEFVFIEGAKEAIQIFSQLFDKIIVITNQRGIGRGFYSYQDLTTIHNHMVKEIETAGGRIDDIFYCTHLRDSSINRKPNIGMGFKAKAKYSEINFDESIFVGNSKSDILFANKLNMLSVLVGDKYQKEHNIYHKTDVYCENLYKFADIVKRNQSKQK